MAENAKKIRTVEAQAKLPGSYKKKSVHVIIQKLLIHVLCTCSRITSVVALTKRDFLTGGQTHRSNLLLTLSMKYTFLFKYVQISFIIIQISKK